MPRVPAQVWTQVPRKAAAKQHASLLDSSGTGGRVRRRRHEIKRPQRKNTAKDDASFDLVRMVSPRPEPDAFRAGEKKLPDGTHRLTRLSWSPPDFKRPRSSEQKRLKKSVSFWFQLRCTISCGPQIRHLLVYIFRAHFLPQK